MSTLQRLAFIEERLSTLRELATISERPILDKNSQRAIKLQLSSDLLTMSDLFYQLAEELTPPSSPSSKPKEVPVIKETSEDDELVTEGRPPIVRRQPRVTSQAAVKT